MSLSIHELATGLGFLPESTAPAPGHALGRFALLRHLGSGATGSVFGAYDPDFDREVALKVLDGDATSEARTLARVSHPNVVSMYDAGVCGERAFIAMELVHGSPLRQWLAQRKHDRSAVLEVFGQLAKGLQAVHAAGLVHRDVKPDNVLVGDDGRVKLADFGLVQSQSAVDSSVEGTPAYMAPELFDGAQPDARSDQFAFAVSLYEALTGSRPFTGRSVLELQQRMRDGDADWSRVDAGLRKVLGRAMHPEPRRRFSSMEGLATALRRAARPGIVAALRGALKGVAR